MRTLLFLVPNLGCDGPAKQVSLLAPALPRDQFTVHVGALAADGIFSEPLRHAGIPVHFLGAQRRMMPAWFALRTLMRKLLPDVVHAWQGASNWAALARMTHFRRAGLPLIASGSFSHSASRLLLSQAARLVVQHPNQVKSSSHHGLTLIPPAVADNPTVANRAKLQNEWNLPEDARLIICAGAIEKDHGFREAVWIFDILRQVYPNLYLIVIGDGTQRRSVEEFALTRGREENRIVFVGVRQDVPELLGLAEMVWICGRRSGSNVALEALAAGRPVVARHRPDLLDLLGDGETGFLVPSGTPAEFARASRRILDDQSLQQRFSASAHARAQRFRTTGIAEQWIKLYTAACGLAFA